MTVEREGEFWPTRIAMLAELAHADGLAIVLRPHGQTFVTYAAHNVDPASAWSGAAQTSLLARATSGLARVFAADGVSIMLVDNGVLSVRSSVGLSDVARRDRKRVGEGISGFVASTGQPLLLRGPITGDARFTGNDPAIGDALIAPLRNGDHTIGVVSVKRRESGPPYGEADLDR